MSHILTQKLRTGDQEFIAYLRKYLGGLSGGGAVAIPIVANFSALPDPTVNNAKLYIALNSQGTRWLPGSLGGTYYANGFYVSDGSVWNYLGEVPNQATQGQVNAEADTYSFITPATLGPWFAQKNVALSQVGPGTITNTEFGYLSGVTSSLQAQLNALAAADIGTPAITTPATSQIVNTNSINFFNTTGGACVATLPTAVGKTGQGVCVIWDMGAASLSMATTSGETIQGQAPTAIKFIRLSQSYQFTSNGVNWMIT